jgi:hypothetical protein
LIWFGGATALPHAVVGWAWGAHYLVVLLRCPLAPTVRLAPMCAAVATSISSPMAHDFKFEYIDNLF